MLACCEGILKEKKRCFIWPDFSASVLEVIFRDLHIATSIVGQWR
jgi:hypothetical protein